jgi:hypothetical protein
MADFDLMTAAVQLAAEFRRRGMTHIWSGCDGFTSTSGSGERPASAPATRAGTRGWSPPGTT